MAVPTTKEAAVKDTVKITKALADIYILLKSTNVRLNGQEALSGLLIADIIETFPYLSALTQDEWAGLASMVGIVYGAVDGNFSGISKIWQLPQL